jgi:hypothetical protein
MPPIEPELDAAVAIVRQEYEGRIEIADDLKSYWPERSQLNSRNSL